MFPAYGTSVPSLNPFEFSFGGIKIGGLIPGTQYQLVGVTGFGLPPVLTGDVQRPGSDGEFIGQDLMPGRDATVSVIVMAIPGQTIDQSILALTSHMSPGGSIETPLFFRKGDAITYAIMARFRDFQVSIDTSYVLAGATVVTLQFHATDPLIYAAPTQQASCSVPVPLAGMTFPLTFPFSFTPGIVGGSVIVTNAGVRTVAPIFVISGPCTNPSIVNESTSDLATIRWNGTLNLLDTLSIDTDLGSATLTTGGVSVARGNLISPTSEWFGLPPGNTQLAFVPDTGSAPAALAVQWASAWPFV